MKTRAYGTLLEDQSEKVWRDCTGGSYKLILSDTEVLESYHDVSRNLHIRSYMRSFEEGVPLIGEELTLTSDGKLRLCSQRATPRELFKHSHLFIEGEGLPQSHKDISDLIFQMAKNWYGSK